MAHGTPVQVLPECLNLNSLSTVTSERDFKVERFGLIRTSLKSSFTSFSILIFVRYVGCLVSWGERCEVRED